MKKKSDKGQIDRKIEKTGMMKKIEAKLARKIAEIEENWKRTTKKLFNNR